MKKIKTLVDREPLGSDYIASKQNFESVCTQVKQLTPTWKTPWFYGPIGLATLAICISVVTVHSSSASEKTVPTKEVLTKKSSDVLKDVVKVAQNEEVEVTPEILAVTEKSTEPKKEPETKSVAIAKTDEVIGITEPENNIPSKVVETINPTVVKRTVAKDNRFPHIAGYFTGEMPVELLFDADGIQLRDGYKIISYDLNFYNGKANIVQSYIGNVIPSDLKIIMENYNVGNMVFITNIKAIDQSGRIFVLPAINYKLVD